MFFTIAWDHFIAFPLIDADSKMSSILDYQTGELYLNTILLIWSILLFINLTHVHKIRPEIETFFF